MTYLLFVLMLSGEARLEVVPQIEAACQRQAEVRAKGAKAYIFQPHEFFSQMSGSQSGEEVWFHSVALKGRAKAVKCRWVSGSKVEFTVPGRWEAQ